jgi:hypothetical protein
VGSGSHRLFWRNLDAGDLLETFLVAAAAAVLVIRAYLAAANYPTIGGEALHIAHMLWGGLLMLAALVICFSFITRSSLRMAAVVGGVGFGTFIDEVGKFVTHDNNYFYEPAVAMIYATLMVTIVAVRAIHSGRSYTQGEFLLNAVRELEEVAAGDLDLDERRRALDRLDRADPHHPLTQTLRSWLEAAPVVPSAHPTLFLRWRRRLDAWYRRVSTTHTFVRVVDVFFLAQLVLKAFYVFALVSHRTFDPISRFAFAPPRSLGTVDVIQLLALVASGVFTLLGVARLPRSRIEAYRSFRRSLLISILITQVFAFAQHQLLALIGLAGNLLVLRTIDLAIERERRDRAP